MKHSRPADIERTSMAIIAEELRQRGIQVPPDQEAVVKRVIHTTADFEYAENLVFTKNAVSLGVAALRKGTPIVTDTNMAKAGISRPGLEKLGSHVMCFMADPAVAQRAEARGTTRAAAAMEQAAQVCPGAVLAIGNAPTALFAISDVLALGAIAGAKELGFRVPEDVAVVGFDDVEHTTMFHPYITTVAQPCYEIGFRAMEMLGKLLRGESVPKSLLLPHRLMARESTAPPRNTDFAALTSFGPSRL